MSQPKLCAYGFSRGLSEGCQMPEENGKTKSGESGKKSSGWHGEYNYSDLYENVDLDRLANALSQATSLNDFQQVMVDEINCNTLAKTKDVIATTGNGNGNGPFYRGGTPM
ncbi:hypothetical protein Rhopal_001319-T1 [Rhodotorula paludigena]|uniref:Uncharacterized protein n=1 Tax=Rhodotorula paludigena TaxID=86838 RepID=A0AAV5GGF7_9BASI|nr:hypothetical protein Rhopal_001319-T1 [Rhodotorula paludigena]